MGWKEVGEWIGGSNHRMQKMTKDGLVDKIVSYFVDMGVFLLYVGSYFNQMFCGVCLLCGSLELQMWWIGPMQTLTITKEVLVIYEGVILLLLAICSTYAVITLLIAYGWKFFKVYHTRCKGLSTYYSPFLPYILIPIKNNESNVVKKFKRTIF